MNDITTPTADLSAYDEAMAAAVRLMTEAQLRLTPEQQAAYKARQKAQEARYEDQRQQENPAAPESRPDPDFEGMADQLDQISITLANCHGALKLAVAEIEESHNNELAPPVAMVEYALDKIWRSIGDMGDELGSYARKFKEAQPSA